MNTIKFPKEHQQMMPYLVLSDTEGFISFMQDVFDASLEVNYQNEHHILAYGELRIGQSILMLSGDTQLLTPATSSAFVYVNDADAVHQKALNAGASSVMDIKESPFGRSGGFQDPFGNTWWIKAYREEE